MSDEVADLKRQVAALVAENEKLKKQLTETRAQRAEYLNYICELLPPVELPSEEEMADQMKHLIPAEQVMREIDEIIRKGGK
jgi:hypothetical protein